MKLRRNAGTAARRRRGRVERLVFITQLQADVIVLQQPIHICPRQVNLQHAAGTAARRRGPCGGASLCFLLPTVCSPEAHYGFHSLPATGTELHVQDIAVKGDAAAHRRDSSEEARASWRPRLSSSSIASRRPTSEDCQPPCEMRSGCAALLTLHTGWGFCNAAALLLQQRQPLPPHFLRPPAALPGSKTKVLTDT